MKRADTKKPKFKISGSKDGVVWGAVQIKGNYPHPVQREVVIESIPNSQQEPARRSHVNKRTN